MEQQARRKNEADQVPTYLETEPGRNVLIEHSHGDHRKRCEEDVVERHCPIVVESLA
jgi:hypothetical protein